MFYQDVVDHHGDECWNDTVTLSGHMVAIRSDDDDGQLATTLQQVKRVQVKPVTAFSQGCQRYINVSKHLSFRIYS